MTDVDDKTYTALGYSLSAGGRQRVDGARNGTETRYQRLRVAAARTVGPRFQIYGEVGADIVRSHGFEQHLGVLVRLLKLF